KGSGMEPPYADTRSDYKTFIHDCRVAMEKEHRATLASREEFEDVIIPFPSTTVREASQFLRIPWQQIQMLVHARLSPTAIYIYLALWRQYMIRKVRPLAVTTRTLAEFGFTRHQKTRALTSLERAGIIQVERHRGRNPRVTLLGKDGVGVREKGRR